MSCNRCKKDICCCVKTISRTGKRGPAGPKGAKGDKGDPGATGASGGRIIFESGDQVLVTGSIVPNKTTNVGANLLSASPGVYLFWIDASISASSIHTVTYYFKKNGVQIGFARTRVLQVEDHINFKTQLFTGLVNTDTIEFYIQTNATEATIANAVIHSIKQL